MHDQTVLRHILREISSGGILKFQLFPRIITDPAWKLDCSDIITLPVVGTSL